MAIINVDDAYVLNETGAQVDKVTGLFTKNENATTGEKQMARLNIAAGGSNRNLLDNAYFVGGGSQLGDGVFPINQRGQTSYNINAYNVDRWLCYASSGSVIVGSGGITAPAFGVMTQPTTNLTQLNGKTLTLSILYDSGLETGTAVLDLSGTTIFIANQGMAYITSGGLVQFYKEAQYTVKAVKLEVGTVSTLANDPPPDFGEELRKCQRYLVYVPLDRYPITFASGAAYLSLIGINMRATPTAALYANNGGVIGSSGFSAAITSVTPIAQNFGVTLLQFNLSATPTDTIGQIYNTTLQLSAEL